MGVGGATPLLLSLPSAISAIFSNHLVESTMIPCHSVNSAILLYDSIRSTVVCAQWRPGMGGKAPLPSSKALRRCAGERKTMLKPIHSTINSHSRKRKGTKQIPARQGNGVRCEAISRAAAVKNFIIIFCRVSIYISTLHVTFHGTRVPSCSAY